MAEIVKVLVVDDEKWLLDRVCETVEWKRFGLKLMCGCENALDALDLMLNEIPDILITDIMMPTIDGLELIRRAKDMNPNLECVILSGYAEFEFARTAMSLGVKHYLLKPFSMEEFERVLEQCVNLLGKRRREYINRLEARTERVEYLAKELRGSYENGGSLTVRILENLMRDYGDLSLLRSAVIYLMTQVSTHSEGERLQHISDLFGNPESIFTAAANALNGVFSQKTNESELVRVIKEYTRAHFGEKDLNLQKIADQVVHFGPKYVGKCFLRETGNRYSEYLYKVRMEKAKELLAREKDWRIEMVAEAVGLGHEVQYFYQLFKKYTGTTPKEYRSRN